MQHVKFHGTKGRWEEQSLNHVYLNFILLAEPLADEGGEKFGVPG